MDVRVVWLSGIVLGAASVAVSCDAPDPGEVTFSEREPTESSSGASGQAPSGDGGGSSGATSSSGGEGGPADPVFGTTTFTAGDPGQNANDVADHAGQTPMEGKNCFQAGGCHSDNDHKWSFAGTVYDSINGGGPVKNAEVRVVGPDGALVGSTYTDDDGNFWYEGPKPPDKSRAGVRNGSGSMKMVGLLLTGTGVDACNAGGTCHGLGTNRIHLP